MPFEDKTFTCADCGQPFIHSAADQERYAARGLTNDPKRCKPCREKRRAQGSSKGGGGRSPGNEAQPAGGREAAPQRRPGRGRFFPASEPRRRTEFHPATCATCGKQTTVPFKPVEGRPVYCRDCFQKSKTQEGRSDDDFGSGL